MNAQIRQEAAEWLIELQLDAPDIPARERFAEWLRTSPEHVRAYLELVTLWDDARHFDSVRRVDVEALINLARNDDNVVALEVSADETDPGAPPLNAVAQTTERQAGRRLARRWLAAGLAAAVLAMSAGVWFLLHRDFTYTTDVGEQRTVKLVDGSIAELNALSRITVHFSEHSRVVELLQGQALFRVAQNKTRPFTVVSGDTRVRAVGTEFDVNRKSTGTVVTVLEGRVAVASPAAPMQDLTVTAAAPVDMEASAGEQIDITARTPTRNDHANVAAATAWTQQQLIFDSTPLGEVADEFNRFNTQKLVVSGDSVRDIRISGNFPALEPASLARFVRFLRTQSGVEIVESPDRILVTAK